MLEMECHKDSSRNNMTLYLHSIANAEQKQQYAGHIHCLSLCWIQRIVLWLTQSLKLNRWQGMWLRKNREFFFIQPMLELKRVTERMEEEKEGRGGGVAQTGFPTQCDSSFWPSFCLAAAAVMWVVVAGVSWGCCCYYPVAFYRARNRWASAVPALGFEDDQMER